MATTKQFKTWIWGVPLVGYWVVLFTVSLLAQSPPDRDYLYPLLVLAGLPIYVVAARVIVHEPEEDTDAALAYTDDLTGLGNRRAFLREAKSILRWARPGRVALVILDVNALKQINDNCGHQAGDELIASVAAQLSNVPGTLYRVGGDEFAILVESPSTSVLGRLSERLEPYSASFSICGHRHEVRVSTGTASNQAGDTVETFFRRADDQLLQHKRDLYESGLFYARGARAEQPSVSQIAS